MNTGRCARVGHIVDVFAQLVRLFSPSGAQYCLIPANKCFPVRARINGCIRNAGGDCGGSNGERNINQKAVVEWFGYDVCRTEC